MTQVAIGVAVHAEPDGLRATLDSLARHTSIEYDCLVIPDGADAATRAALTELRDVVVLDDPGPRGEAACLNVLARTADAHILVLLESGCRVAPGSLEALVTALTSFPTAGLAGPSTNRSWNEQRVFPNAGGSVEDLVRIAAEARSRFGNAAHTLEPLFSLADFCYAVRREVFDAVGEADESYGLGPCWEMDFNIRAARAGFDGIWVCGSYVWRAPFTARRERAHALSFEASKHRYQDRFCGARLDGRKSDYRGHCRGDACPNFAPQALITIRPPDRPRPADTLLAASQPIVPLVHVRATDDAPLVSCIMPTADRRSFIPQAIACFQAQDYPNLELIVVDDGRDSVADLLPNDPRIIYMRLRERRSVGVKRNLACRRARGRFIAHWDDDDWYPARRVSVQVRALLEHGRSICGTSVLYYDDQRHNRAFCYRYTGGGLPWVAGNTLVYRREEWRRRPFTDVQVGEDAQFVWGGADRLLDLQDPTLCVASVHGANISPKNTAGMFWSPESKDVIRRLMTDDGAASPLASTPLVSCIMPTYNRRPFIRLAIACFRAQTYPNRELVVIDDGRDAIADLVGDEPGVRYVRIDGRLPIGAKRNRACAEARGEIVAHWDDDDWYAPDRLERQAAPILRGDADITGLENRFVLQMPHRRFWTLDARLHRSMFVGDVHGGTLVFRRSIWAASVHYPEVDLAEDAMLLQEATARGYRLLKIDNSGSFVYLRHSRNAWQFDTGSFLDPSGWCHSGAPQGFTQQHLDAYATAASLLSV